MAIRKLIICGMAVTMLACGQNDSKIEETKASDSRYNNNISEATTSWGLSKADLAWHAQNTYGWNCPAVISKNMSSSSEYYFIECSSGKKLRVYERPGKHPKITNEKGGYN